MDTADKQPCIGTGGMAAWRLKATGKLFHSGLAHKVTATDCSVSSLAVGAAGKNVFIIIKVLGEVQRSSEAESWEAAHLQR